MLDCKIMGETHAGRLLSNESLLQICPFCVIRTSITIIDGYDESAHMLKNNIGHETASESKANDSIHSATEYLVSVPSEL